MTTIVVVRHQRVNKIFPIPRHDVTNKNDDINNLLKIYHQNIQGLKGKTNEIVLSLLTEAPHLICLTEQHLNNYKTDVTPICNYKLGVKYCRRKLKTGGVCICIQEALKFTNISLQNTVRNRILKLLLFNRNLTRKIRRFPYPYGLCNPVQIYGRKIYDIIGSLLCIDFMYL